MYQISGRDQIFAWLEHEPDMTRRSCLLEWLGQLAQYPLRDAARLPGVRAPVFIQFVAMTSGPGLAITYLVDDQFHVVRILQIRALQ